MYVLWKGFIMYYTLGGQEELFSPQTERGILSLKKFPDSQWCAYAFKRLKDFHQSLISWSFLVLFYFCLFYIASAISLKIPQAPRKLEF